MNFKASGKIVYTMEPLFCYICDHKSACYSKNISSIRSKHSKVPIVDVIKRFLDSDLPIRISLNSENTVICVECLNKIDEYDLACLTVKRVEQELREILLHTESRYQQAADEAAANQLFECINVATIDVIKCEPDLSDEEHTADYDKDIQCENKFKGEISGIRRNTNVVPNSKIVDLPNQKSSIEKPKFTTQILNTLSKKRATLPFKCTICLAAFSIETHLNIHKRKHVKLVDPKIRAATVVKSVETIKEKADRKEASSWYCRECPAEFSAKTELAEHYRSHEISQYRCSICFVESKDETESNTHNELHRGLPALQCIVCKRKLSSKGGLVKHMRIHVGKMLFQCDVCGKEFIHKTSFDMHMMIHSGIREKACHLCPLKFRSTSHLNKHIPVHSGTKPHACPECGKKFAHRQNMNVHRRQHNPSDTMPVGKTHQCSICDEIFDRPSKLAKHCQKAHGILNPQAKEENRLDRSNQVRKHWIPKKDQN